MLNHQVYHSHGYAKPLLTWRGMQAWCLGRRASGLCRFFIRIRTRPKLRIASFFPLTKARNPQTFFLNWLAHTKQQSRKPVCCLPIIKREGRARCQNVTHPHHDLHAQSQQKAFKKDVVSDNQHHDMHVRSQKLFKRVDESHAKAHEFSTQLGSAESSVMSCLQRQSSYGEIPFNSRSISSSSSTSSSSASGSFHRVSGCKLRETCAKVVHGSPSLCELVAGNQFLVHLSAAPVVATPPHSSGGGLGTRGSSMKDKNCELNPSMGLVANPSLRLNKESDINDRIVFFK